MWQIYKSKWRGKHSWEKKKLWTIVFEKKLKVGEEKQKKRFFSRRWSVKCRKYFLSKHLPAREMRMAIALCVPIPTTNRETINYISSSLDNKWTRSSSGAQRRTSSNAVSSETSLESYHKLSGVHPSVVTFNDLPRQ